jgi:hypothetical protein
MRFHLLQDIFQALQNLKHNSKFYRIKKVNFAELCLRKASTLKYVSVDRSQRYATSSLEEQAANFSVSANPWCLRINSVRKRPQLTHQANPKNVGLTILKNRDGTQFILQNHYR